MKHFGVCARGARGEACQNSTRNKIHRDEINQALPLAGEIRNLPFAIAEQDRSARLETIDPTRLRLHQAALDNGGSQDNEGNTVAGLHQQLFSDGLCESICIEPSVTPRPGKTVL